MGTDAVYPHVARFRALFDGLDSAFGTGKGQWVKRPPQAQDFIDHLNGVGPGIGIGPLRPDNTVKFAAIDLDEPDFEAARLMQKYIPGVSWVERSRSGNAHVWTFFKEPIEAWVPMGILSYVIEAAGKKNVEVFPKNHNFAMVSLGNYINLPYHGSSRPVVGYYEAKVQSGREYPEGLELQTFLELAHANRNDPDEWRAKAKFMLIDEPKPRGEGRFGEQNHLHICAAHIIDEGVPIHEGNRNAVFFMLAKCLSNWSQIDEDDALGFMQDVNELSPDPLSRSELKRILGNAVRGRYTSTGCDDPLVHPYADPTCPIAYPRS